MPQRYYLFFILSISLFFANCNKNNKILDLSSIDLEIDINRYEKKFFALDSNNLIFSLQELRKEDSVFFDFYTIQVMRFGKITDTVSPVILSIDEFLTNKNVQELRDIVNNTFSNLAPLKIELTAALKYFKYYFPNKQIPEIRTIISEFGYNAVSLDSTYLVFGLDMYLGKDFKYYGSFDFPNYIIKRFEKDYMVSNAMEVIYKQYFEESELLNTKALVYAMIEHGKKLYFLESMMPEKDKHLLIGYTQKQMTWCEESEADIWAFYNEQDLFYSKNYMEHKKHVEDGPQTSGMPKEAPGNVGSWVGWQIVNQYMKNAQEKVSLAQLLKTDAETIMNKSKYKPK
tara:strand:- start:1416 stop:2444 length:1029 start_codon:yes stop_codon:yes gene_type:complete